MSVDILNSSRLENAKFGCRMVETECLDGITRRLEYCPFFCVSCGTFLGECSEGVVGISLQCRTCFEKYGGLPGTAKLEDEVFGDAVVYEIRERFGRDLTVEELMVAEDRGQLGTALELLAKESPYKAWEGK